MFLYSCRSQHNTDIIALDIIKAFDAINIHTLIDKFTHTRMPNNITKFIADYIIGRKAYTTLETLYPPNANLKLEFHKYTPQAYHHLDTHYSSHMQTTSPSLQHT